MALMDFNTPGILLRVGSKQDLLPIKEGELVYANDTFEIGTIINGEEIWQEWKSERETSHILGGSEIPSNDIGELFDLYIRVIDDNGLFSVEEYRKEQNGWRKIEMHGSEDTSNLHPQKSPYLGKQTYDLDDGYTPEHELAVVTFKYIQELFDGIDGGNLLSLTDGFMNENYTPENNKSVLTVGYLKNNEVCIKLPTTEPCVPGGGALWNDNGVVKLSRDCDPTQAHIRYFTTQPLTFSDGITRNPTNGYIDIIGNDEIYLNYGVGQENVTKIQVLRYGNRTSWANLAYYCRNMTEFEVLATDESKVTNFESTWYYCKSLTSFPELDVSNGTDFSWVWGGCSSLTSFPELDVSNGTNFYGAWWYCSSLTSFPELDVSNGTDFRDAWSRCSSLTSFPVLDVSNGANFESTWYYCTSLTSFPELDVSNGTNFYGAWQYCSSLTSFPVLDVSNGTDFRDAWNNCLSLTSFPVLDMSNGTNFYGAWSFCSSLTSFPVLDVSNGTNFYGAWQYCSSLTSFPVLDVSNGVNFGYAWYDCSSLTSFPVLDVSNGTNFSWAWYNCNKLPHCPAGNEITIPSGADTTGMCGGSCCTG